MLTLAHALQARDKRPSLGFRLEPAGDAHLAAIAAIYREQIESGSGTFEDPIPDARETGRRLGRVRADGLPAYVALDARDDVLGFCWARPFRALAAYRGTVEDSIHVARHARRRGVGHALLAAVIETCARQGFAQMIAVVGDARNVASIQLHESLGFVAVGYLPGAGGKPGGAVDVVLLQRALAPGRVVLTHRAA
jgi:L-amino acid N-acyltransferase YncA